MSLPYYRDIENRAHATKPVHCTLFVIAMKTTTAFYSIIANAARAAWSELTTDEAFDTYIQKACDDINLTLWAVHVAAIAAYDLGVQARQWSDDFVHSSYLSLPQASEEIVEGELIEDEPPTTPLLPPAFAYAVSQAVNQAIKVHAAYKSYVLALLGINARDCTVKQLKTLLGVKKPLRKAQLLALMPGGANG